jgi:hypothetical protein
MFNDCRLNTTKSTAQVHHLPIIQQIFSAAEPFGPDGQSPFFAHPRADSPPPLAPRDSLEAEKGTSTKAAGSHDSLAHTADRS